MIIFESNKLLAEGIHRVKTRRGLSFKEQEKYLRQTAAFSFTLSRLILPSLLVNTDHVASHVSLTNFQRSNTKKETRETARIL